MQINLHKCNCMDGIRFCMSYQDAIELIKKRAKELGLSQTDISRKSGLSNSQISRIFKFQSTASQEALVSLAQAVNYSPENILRMAKVLPLRPDTDLWVEEQIYKLQQIPPALRPTAEKIIASFADADDKAAEFHHHHAKERKTSPVKP